MKMKKWVSIVLVVMMMCMLLPMSVLAAPNESGNVHVNVYGKLISEYLYSDNDKDLTAIMNLIKTQVKDSMAGEKIPECTIVLEGEDGTIYHFKKQKNPDTITDSIEFVGDVINKYYQTYVSTEYIPDGPYTLKINNIDRDGYSLKAPASGELEVEVKLNNNALSFLNSKETHIGAMKEFKKEISGLFGTHTIGMALPGVYLNRVDSGISFIKTDLADAPLEGADFLMVDRNETIKIVKAMIALGKDTFTNAMKLVGTEGFTWEELSILNAGLISRDEETNQIGLDPIAVQNLVGTYWALVEASAKMPIKDFLKEELRVPAVLKATSGEDGIVKFTEDSNITLVWSINALMNIANISNDWIQNINSEDVFRLPIYLIQHT